MYILFILIIVFFLVSPFLSALLLGYVIGHSIGWESAIKSSVSLEEWRINLLEAERDCLINRIEVMQEQQKKRKR